MISNKSSNPTGGNARRAFLVYGLLLLAILAVLFFHSFLPGIIHFNNDTPLGVVKPLHDNLGTSFLGRWSDLNSVGNSIGAASPCLSVGILWVLGAVGFAKFYAPIALLVLGLCAWFFFRQLKLSPVACILGGLAAALSSDFFATACWGVAGQSIAFGMCYLALAAVVCDSPRGKWARIALAGMAVGMAVTEGADIGAMFSLVVAAFVLYHSLAANSRPLPKRVGFGVLRVGVVALFAGWLACGVVTELVSTQIKGVAGMQDSGQSKAARWSWATQWSLPKREILELAVPGLFGFRMDTPEGGSYWGAGGRDLAWDAYFEGGQKGPPPGGFIRYGGGGLYAGILVVLVAAWAGAQALRKQGSVFSLDSRRLLWFWLGLMLISMLLAFGRHAPFYWFLYQLPGVSFIRNPAKFMHVFDWALVVVFAYGVHGLTRHHMESKAAEPSSRLSGFDRKWTLGCVAAIGLSLLAWLIYSSSRASLENYLQTVQFSPEMAKEIAGFSIQHAGGFVLLLAAATGLVTLVLKGYFTGARAKWGGIWLGLFLVLDLGLANQPWIRYWDYKQKYATNPIIDQLRLQPYEHRVVILPGWVSMAFRLPPDMARAEEYLDHLYRIEWAQHHFQYYGIQSLDIVQMPRVPEDIESFERAMQFLGTPETVHLVTRRWQLTNTRYLLGMAGFLEVLNQGLDAGRQRFKIATRFDIVPRDASRPSGPEEWNAVSSTNGTYALFEFTGALPRAKLYTSWQVSTNDQATLKQLADPAFDPEQTVLVATPVTRQSEATAAQPSTSSVEFTGYTPVRIDLRAKAAAPSVLLLNDRFDAGWKVFVDGKPATLLRCNYIMRGVQVPPGEHQVEFRFAPPVPGLYVGPSALVVAVLLVGYLAFSRKPEPQP